MHNTLYLYISRTAGDARAASEGEKLRALDAFWKKTGLEPEEIVKTPQGKPVFPSGRFHLSVTHTGNLFAAVFAPRPVGIDAERSTVEKRRVAQKLFSPGEQALPFSAVWCGKEAVAKLLGDGISVLSRVAVQPGRAVLDGTNYTLREIAVDEYRLVIATEEGWDYAAEALSEK